MAYSHPLAFLLGLEGVALLRAQIVQDYDAAFVLERFREIERLVTAGGELRQRSGTDVSSVTAGTRERDDAWAEHYDDPGNALIDVEEPLVHQILDQLPPGRALDAACGTGRLIEHGTHAELVPAGGHYADLYHLQARGYR